MMTSPAGLGARSAAAFNTTRWTQVRQAKVDSEDGRRALSDLCAAYYEPVVVYLRHELRTQTHEHEGADDAAREMAHDFFARLLAGGSIRPAEPGQGRFRSYLLGAVKHFLSHQRVAARSLKRGGGLAPVSLDEDSSAGRVIPDPRQVAADSAFDRQWALTMLAQAMEHLRAEFAEGGKEALLDDLKPWLMGDAAHGDQAALAARWGMGASAMKMSIQRLRLRYRECIQAEVAETLDDAAMVQDEMRMLLSALSA